MLICTRLKIKSILDSCAELITLKQLFITCIEVFSTIPPDLPDYFIKGCVGPVLLPFHSRPSNTWALANFIRDMQIKEVYAPIAEIAWDALIKVSRVKGYYWVNSLEKAFSKKQRY